MTYIFARLSASGEELMTKTVRTEELPLATPTNAPTDIPVKNASPPLAQAGPDEFNWDDPNEDAIVLREQRATAVYRNRAGEVVIRQRGPWPDEDSFLYLSSENEVAFMEGMAEQIKK
jgi:hypothetical protein